MQSAAGDCIMQQLSFVVVGIAFSLHVFLSPLLHVMSITLSCTSLPGVKLA